MIYVFPLTAGFTITLSIIQNGRLSSKIGLKNTTLLNFITGLFGSLLLFVFSNEALSIYGNYRDVPLLGYIGGILGVTVVMLSSYVINKISVIAATMLIYIGQLSMGFLIDYLRGVSLPPLKLLGFAFIIVGIYVINKIDIKTASS